MTNHTQTRNTIKNFHCSLHGSITPVPYCPKCTSTSIAQALAEERERLLREIDEMKGYTVNIPVIDPSLGELTESDIDFVEHINGQILFKNKVKQNLTNKYI